MQITCNCCKRKVDQTKAVRLVKGKKLVHVCNGCISMRERERNYEHPYADSTNLSFKSIKPNVHDLYLADLKKYFSSIYRSADNRANEAY